MEQSISKVGWLYAKECSTLVGLFPLCAGNHEFVPVAIHVQPLRGFASQITILKGLNVKSHVRSAW
ncbi:MAG: hypothetical protein K9H64_20800 [Bacteroidales bacterium]|nr:hypothetical protein [Bacteroidales bacterium]MCF8458453.1 hypothetical protein [Bacteroidales bacterium]